MAIEISKSEIRIIDEGIEISIDRRALERAIQLLEHAATINPEEYGYEKLVIHVDYPTKTSAVDKNGQVVMFYEMPDELQTRLQRLFFGKPYTIVMY